MLHLLAVRSLQDMIGDGRLRVPPQGLAGAGGKDGQVVAHAAAALHRRVPRPARDQLVAGIAEEDDVLDGLQARGPAPEHLAAWQIEGHEVRPPAQEHRQLDAAVGHQARGGIRALDEVHAPPAQGDRGIDDHAALRVVRPQPSARAALAGEDRIAGDHRHEIAPDQHFGVDRLLAKGAAGASGAAHQQAAFDRHAAPFVVPPVGRGGHAERLADVARLRVQGEALAARGDVQPVVGGRHAPRVLEGPQANGARHVALPERRPVVGVDGDDAVVARDEHPPVLVQRGDVLVVPVRHVARPGPAEPLEIHGPGRDGVAAAGRVARISVEVRPVARSRHGPARNRGRQAQLRLFHPPTGGNLRPPLRETIARRRPRRHQDETTAAGTQHAIDLGGRVGQLAGEERLLGDDQVRPVAGKRQPGRVALVDRDPRAVHPRLGQTLSGFGHLLGIRLDAHDLELRAPGDLVGQTSLARPQHQAVSLGRPRTLDRGLRRPGVERRLGVGRVGRRLRGRLDKLERVRPGRARSAGLKTMHESQIGARVEPAVAGRQAVGLAPHGSFPELSAVRRAKGRDPVQLADEDGPAGQDQLVRLHAGDIPLHVVASRAAQRGDAGLILGRLLGLGLQAAELEPMRPVQRVKPILGEDVAHRPLGNDPQPIGEHDLLFRLGRAGMDAPRLAGAIEHEVVDEDRETAARRAVGPPARQTTDRLPAAPVEHLGGRPARGREQARRRRQQVALRGDVDLLLPEFPAVVGVHGAEIIPLGRKQPGAEVHHPVLDHDPAAHGPERHHPAVAGQAAVFRAAAVLPDQTSVVGAEAPDAAVVGTGVDPAAGKRRRQAHRAVGGERPAHPAVGRIEAIERVVGRRAVVHRPVAHRHVEGPVVGGRGPQAGHAAKDVLPGGQLRPGGIGRVRRAVRPGLRKRQRERLGRYAATAGIVPVGRPRCPARSRARHAHGDPGQASHPTHPADRDVHRGVSFGIGNLAPIVEGADPWCQSGIDAARLVGRQTTRRPSHPAFPAHRRPRAALIP